MTEEERVVFERLRRAASIIIKNAGRPLTDARLFVAIPHCVKAVNAAERILDPLRSSVERQFVESDSYDDPRVEYTEEM